MQRDAISVQPCNSSCQAAAPRPIQTPPHKSPERKRRDLSRGFARGRTLLTRPSGSRGIDELVDLPPRLEPVDVAGEGAFMHFAKEFDGFRFVAWFAWIFGRDNLLDINRHDQPICLD